MSENNDSSGFVGLIIIMIMVVYFLFLSADIKRVDNHMTKLETTIAECVKK